MKYIDADRLRARIENLKIKVCGSKATESDITAALASLDLVIRIIDSLQQEQPFLPDNLDEEAYNWAMKDSVVYISRKKSFKAGAEWMAKQMNNDN